MTSTNMYTAEEIATLNSISISIGTLKLLLDNNEIRTYSPTYNITTPISLQKGKLQKLRIQLIANANKMTTTANSPLWGLRNLYYNANATAETGGLWRMRDHNSGIYFTPTSEVGIQQEFWNWNALTSGAGTAKTGTGDPSSKVYPEGTWRLPNKAEYDDLLSNTSKMFQTSTDARFMTINQQAGVTPTSQGEFSFLKYRFRNSDASDLPNTISSFNGSNSNGSGFYWTSTSDDSNTDEAYVLRFNITSENSGNVSVTTLNKNLGANIKCVRNNGLGL